jgi:RHS repeat-associated protein
LFALKCNIGQEKDSTNTRTPRAGINTFTFADGLYDKDTKLIKFGYRECDSHTGRWTSKDPIDFNGGSLNLYGYVLGDPVNLVDPNGLIQYNAPAPRTIPVEGVTNDALICLEGCLQRVTNNPNLDLLVTGGAEPDIVEIAIIIQVKHAI